jgi:putative DNA methylase
VRLTSAVWRSRGYLPHCEAGEIPQSITFRLADSLPATVLERWGEELRHLPKEAQTAERLRRAEYWLDKGSGSMALRDPRVARVVEGALQHFDGDRYRLHAWCVMPNHVHVLATPMGSHTLSAIAHSWKSFTAKSANAVLNREGRFWAPEYFDRFIRDGAHFERAIAYIAMNPVKAGLCAAPEEWRFSSFFKGGRDARGP